MKIGDRVYIPRLRDEGRVESIGKVFRVRVDTIVVELPPWEVEPLTEKMKRQLAKRKKQTPKVTLQKRQTAAPTKEIDLHGLRVEEALAVLNQHLNQAIMSGLDRIAIIHGIGTGRVKQAVHQHLAQTSAVASFKEDPRNAGMTWVYF